MGPLGRLRRGRLFGFEEAKGLDKSLLFWGARWLRYEAAKYHFAVSGTTRSGKSLIMRLFVRSIMPMIVPGSGQKLVLFDPKNELHRSLFEGAAVPVHFLLPTDLRSSRWDLARDFDSPASIVQAAEAYIPKAPGEASPFFSDSCRDLLGRVMLGLHLTCPYRWDLGDVVRILKSKEYLKRVLGRWAEEDDEKLSYFENEKTWNDIRATIETHLHALQITAAMWSRAERTFSLREFMETESVVVLGRDPRYAALLDAGNVLFLTQLFGHLLRQPDDPEGRRRTYVVIDELSAVAGEGKPLPGFTDVCERGASKGVVVATAYQSYASVKALYKEASDAALGQLQHQIYLKANDKPTAEYCAAQFGKSRKWVDMRSYQKSKGGGGEKESETRSYQWHERFKVTPELFRDIVPASRETGIWGFQRGPDYSSPEPLHLPGEWVEANLPHEVEEVEGYEERPSTHQYLRAFSFRDLERLCLVRPEEGGADGAGDVGRVKPKRPAPATAAEAESEPPADAAVGRLRHLMGVLSDDSAGE